MGKQIDRESETRGWSLVKHPFHYVSVPSNTFRTSQESRLCQTDGIQGKMHGTAQLFSLLFWISSILTSFMVFYTQRKFRISAEFFPLCVRETFGSLSTFTGSEELFSIHFPNQKIIIYFCHFSVFISELPHRARTFCGCTWCEQKLSTGPF